MFKGPFNALACLCRYVFWSNFWSNKHDLNFQQTPQTRVQCAAGRTGVVSYILLIILSTARMASLTFFAPRLLLAAEGDLSATNCNQDCCFLLALQFLDYPLLVLQPSHSCASQHSSSRPHQVTYTRGKTCVLAEADCKEAVHLCQQVSNKRG